MHPYNEGISALFREHQDLAKSVSAKSYLRNQFEFFGIPAPMRRILSKKYIKDQGIPAYAELHPLVLELFALPERELQYFGMELLAAAKKRWQEDSIQLMETLILTKSWWDTVDFIAPVLAGNYFKIYPLHIKEITGRWNRSANFWLQRSSLLFQLKYKKETSRELLQEYILSLASSKEFFIQKAVGWVLREYAKTNPAWVMHFVANHKLATLSTREAIRRIK